MDGMGAASEAVVSEALILDNYLLPAYWRALTFTIAPRAIDFNRLTRGAGMKERAAGLIRQRLP
jgi:hypothetical protein